MQLTKGQLKRIIREEYSRLNRRGLIRENNDMSPNEMRADEYRRKNNLPATSLREMDNDFPESDLMVELAEQLTYAMAVEMGLGGSDFKSRDQYFELMRTIFGIVGANTNGKV